MFSSLGCPSWGLLHAMGGYKSTLPLSPLQLPLSGLGAMQQALHQQLVPLLRERLIRVAASVSGRLGGDAVDCRVHELPSRVLKMVPT